MNPFNTTKVISPATYLIAGVALLFAGAIIGAFTDPYLPSTLSNAKKGYQTGFTAAQTLVENSSLGSFFRTQNEVRTVVGTVTAIEGNRITLHSNSTNNPFDGPGITDYIVTIDTNTKVIQLTAKDSKTVQAEIDAFIKAQRTAHSTSTPITLSAEPYVQTVVEVSRIKVGDLLTVTANENIKTLEEFIPSLIQIQPNTLAR